MTEENLIYVKAEEWMKTTLPNCISLDVNYTFEKFDFPDYVRNWILKTWNKINDENGGTYEKPNMDATNQEALHVLKNKGCDAAVKFMFTDQETGRELSYSEMRARYG